MKGLIFAAGLGTRLYPLTAETPKALVAVGGTPMLQRIIEKFKSAGVTEIVINVHHFADKISGFLSAHENFGVDIHISHEKDYPLETGGGMLRAARWLYGDEQVIVHNADILTDFCIQEMIDAHNRWDVDVTLLVDNRKSSRQLLLDADDRMRGWTNTATGQVKPAGINDAILTRRAFGGVHIINPRRFFELLERYSADDVFSIMPFYISACDALVIKGFTPSREYGWHDIGTMEKLRSAENYLLSK